MKEAEDCAYEFAEACLDKDIDVREAIKILASSWDDILMSRVRKDDVAFRELLGEKPAHGSIGLRQIVY